MPTTAAIVLTLLTSWAALAAPQAQPAQPPDQTAQAVPRPAARWTDPEFERIGTMLAGSWKSVEDIATVGGGEGEAGVVLNIAPVGISGLPNAMYAEVCRADNLRVPYRQTVLVLQRVNARARLVTFEFRRAGGRLPSANAAWAEPYTFPELRLVDDLLGTLAVELTPQDGGYSGRSPHPYPTSQLGAADMTTDMEIRENDLRIADRGFAPDGSQAWGPPSGEFTQFVRWEPGFVAVKFPVGLVSITYPGEHTGETAKTGERVTVNYIGYLEDGETFDATYERGSTFSYLVGQPLIPGWNMLNQDLRKGMFRRIFVPARFGFAERGMGRTVPPHAVVIYDIEVLNVEPAPPRPETAFASPPAAPGLQVPGSDAPKPEVPE